MTTCSNPKIISLPSLPEFQGSELPETMFDSKESYLKNKLEFSEKFWDIYPENPERLLSKKGLLYDLALLILLYSNPTLVLFLS